MKIKGFAHFYLINHWYTVVSEQMRIILTSGLYDACEEINVSLIGFPEDVVIFKKLFSELYPKLIIRKVSAEPMDYEFNALRLIESDNSPYIGFYFHTKAVSRPFEPYINYWRSWLNEAILNRWREHANRVETYYDVSSVNEMKSPDHFSGNFWWFNREYINRLPKIDTLDLKNRFAAEQWICMCKNRKTYAKEFVEPGRDTFLMQYKHD
jgi:hypothetical protein